MNADTFGRVTPAREEDAQAVSRLSLLIYNELSYINRPEKYRRIIRGEVDDNLKLWTYRDTGGAVRGYVLAGADPDSRTGYVIEIAVDHDFQGRPGVANAARVGTALLAHALLFLEKKGMTKIDGSTRNSRAGRLSKTFGFRCAGTPEADSGSFTFIAGDSDETQYAVRSTLYARRALGATFAATACIATAYALYPMIAAFLTRHQLFSGGLLAGGVWFTAMFVAPAGVADETVASEETDVSRPDYDTPEVEDGPDSVPVIAAEEVVRGSGCAGGVTQAHVDAVVVRLTAANKEVCAAEPVAAWPLREMPVTVGDTVYMMNEEIPAGLEKGRVYEVRYDKTRFMQNAAGLKELLEEYVSCLRMRVRDGRPEEVIKLIGNGSADPAAPLLSVTCYEDRTKRKVLGEAGITMDGDLAGQRLDIPGIMNMLFAAAHIPSDTPPEGLVAYQALVSYIQREYRAMTGADLAIDKLWRIPLPRSERHETKDLEAYYRLTTMQLRQAA